MDDRADNWGDMNLVHGLPTKLEAAVAKLLAPDEVIYIKIKGTWKEGLVCTDRRVIIVKSGFMTDHLFGTNIFQLPYSNITSVQVNRHWRTGYLEVSAGGMQNTNKSYWATDKGHSSSSAPNCVTLNSPELFDRFQLAATFITQRIEAAHSGNAPLPASAAADPMAVLERLVRLRDSGAVTEAEFEAKKRQLLDQI